MSNRIKVVFFDLGNTLVEIMADVLDAILIVFFRLYQEKQGISIKLTKKQLRDLFHAAHDAEWDSRVNQNFQWVQTSEDEYRYWFHFFACVLNRLGITPLYCYLLDESDEVCPDYKIIDKARKYFSEEARLVDLLAHKQADPRSFHCFSEVTLTLTRLLDYNIDLGIISNAFPSASQILDFHKLAPMFKYWILSYELQWAKPDPLIYRHAIEVAGVQSSETLFVDDRPDFVSAAQEQMISYLIDRSNKHPGWKQGRISSLDNLFNYVQYVNREDENITHYPYCKRKFLDSPKISGEKRGTFIMA